MGPATFNVPGLGAVTLADGEPCPPALLPHFNEARRRSFNESPAPGPEATPEAEPAAVLPSAGDVLPAEPAPAVDPSLLTEPDAAPRRRR